MSNRTDPLSNRSAPTQHPHTSVLLMLVIYAVMATIACGMFAWMWRTMMCSDLPRQELTCVANYS